MPQKRNDISDSERLKKSRERSREIYEHSGKFSPTEMIESGKAKKYSAKQEITKFMLYGSFLVVSLVLTFVFVYFGWTIKTVEVTNKTDFFADEVISAVNIGGNSSFIFTKKETIENRIRENIPFVGSVKVKKQFPSKVIISIEKAQGKYYVCAGGEYFVLDEERRVIGNTDNVEEIELMGCILLQSKEISKCRLGHKITFYDKDIDGVLDELITLLTDRGMIGFCNSITIDSKFDIRFESYGRYTVLLGDLRDLELKMALLFEVLNDLPPDSGGKIDVSDKNLRKAVVTLFN